jgi:MarR family multiple antibiotic resistance transcriptional regulator
MADTALSGSLDLGALFTDLVRVETRLYNAVADHVKAGTGISSGHFDFLRYVRDHPNPRVADLAAGFAIGVGTTSKIVDRLEREGWLERRPNPANRRSSLLALTKEGASVVARTEPTWQAGIQNLIGAAITREELKTLAQLLGALRSDLEQRQLGLPVG